jgi:hypothetical protein
MTTFDETGFLTTLGREFCAVLRTASGVESPDEPSGQDCYSVISDYLDDQPVSPKSLQKLNETDFADLAQAFNDYFEVSSVTSDHIRASILATLRHWIE